jgi:hypothetical protein
MQLSVLPPLFCYKLALRMIYLIEIPAGSVYKIVRDRPLERWSVGGGGGGNFRRGWILFVIYSFFATCMWLHFFRFFCLYEFFCSPGSTPLSNGPSFRINSTHQCAHTGLLRRRQSDCFSWAGFGFSSRYRLYTDSYGENRNRVYTLCIFKHVPLICLWPSLYLLKQSLWLYIVYLKPLLS